MQKLPPSRTGLSCSGTTFSVVRLRHAYLNLDWGTSALLLGQTWHPLYGDVAPQILNLNMGAPFQPFSRAPQIRYRYKTGDIQITGAAPLAVTIPVSKVLKAKSEVHQKQLRTRNICRY